MTGKFDVHAHVTAAIVAELEKGVAPWRRPWSSGGSGLRMPLRVTGEPYRGINVVMLWRAALERGHAAQTWMTYRQAARLGGQVRRGERGTLVIKVGTVERASAVAGEDPGRISFVRSYRVFNVAQIDGLDAAWYAAPEPPRSFGAGSDPAVMGWFGRTGLRLRSTPEPRAYYSPAQDVIHMPPAETFEDAAAWTGVLLHEACHATGHEGRLAREYGAKFGDAAYAREELVAEIGAAMVEAQLGIATRLEQSAAYLQAWIDVLRSDSRAIMRASSAAQAAADWLMDRGGALSGAAAEAAAA